MGWINVISKRKDELTKFSSLTAPTSNDSFRSPGLSGLVLDKVNKMIITSFYNKSQKTYIVHTLHNYTKLQYYYKVIIWS